MWPEPLYSNGSGYEIDWNIAFLTIVSIAVKYVLDNFFALERMIETRYCSKDNIQQTLQFCLLSASIREIGNQNSKY